MKFIAKVIVGTLTFDIVNYAFNRLTRKIDHRRLDRKIRKKMERRPTPGFKPAVKEERMVIKGFVGKEVSY